MKKNEIQTFSYRISQANKTQLIVIMYDMAIQYVSDAIENNYETQAEKDEYESDVVQVKRVVDSLVTSLDMQYEVSVQLYNIYLVMQRYLVKAVAKKDKNTIMLLESVKKMLETMRKSFYELSKQDDSEPLMKIHSRYMLVLHIQMMVVQMSIQKDTKTEDIKFEIIKLKCRR